MNMSAQRNALINSQSYHHRPVTPKSQPDIFSKSDLDCSVAAPFSAVNHSEDVNSIETKFFPETTNLAYDGEYYKKYEHDEVPVKDSDKDLKEEMPYKKSLTNSDLDDLERRIYKNVSQELQTDDGSLGSLESNIKFFKVTVEKIFDNFYSTMRDFEHYKRRFQEILNKSKEGSVDDMESFIKDMFDHILSSENSLAKISRHSVEMPEIEDRQTRVSSCGDSAQGDSSGNFLEAFKNDHFFSDSADENCSKSKKISDLEEMFNIIFLSGGPCVAINLFGRNMLSEMNVKEPTRQKTTQSIASADNLRKLAAKRLELEKYLKHEYDGGARNTSDRDIPVKVSFAKKNIHLNEDFSRTDTGTSKSFLAKFCNLLCRKFRRSSV